MPYWKFLIVKFFIVMFFRSSEALRKIPMESAGEPKEKLIKEPFPSIKTSETFIIMHFFVEETAEIIDSFITYFPGLVMVVHELKL